MPEDENGTKEIVTTQSSELSDTDDNQDPEEDAQPVIAATSEVVQDPIEYASPYAGYKRQDDTPAVPGELAEYLSPEAFAALDRYYTAKAERISEERVSLALQAQAQARAAVRQIGLPAEVLDYYGDAMQRAEPLVPSELRGTKEGSILAFNSAVNEEMLRTKDVAGTIKKLASLFGGEAPAVQQAKQTVQPLEPAARVNNNRGGAARITSQPKNESFATLRNSWGATDEELAEIRKEKPTYA